MYHLPLSLLGEKDGEAELPMWIEDSWQTVRQLYLERNEMTNFSSSLLQLTDLTWLSLSGNSFHVVPKEVTQLINMSGINLASNSISSLPYELGEMPWTNVQLQWNLIQSYHDLPWDKQTLLDWDNENEMFALTGNSGS